MKESSTTQEKFYKDYWNKIEKNTNYRSHLQIKTIKIANYPI